MTDVFKTEDGSTDNADAAALAKRLADKDAFIAQLQEENARDRELATKTVSEMAEVKELLKKLQEQKPATPPEKSEVKPDVVPSGLSDEDFAKRIKAVNETLSREEKLKNNVELVAQELVKVFGDEVKANEAVKQKAAELGVSTGFLQKLASESPKAFLVQMGVTEKSITASPAPARSTLNTSSLVDSRTQDARPGTYKYWQEEMKKFPNRILPPKLQNQMHEEALKLGDAFYA